MRIFIIYLVQKHQVIRFLRYFLYGRIEYSKIGSSIRNLIHILKFDALIKNCQVLLWIVSFISFLYVKSIWFLYHWFTIIKLLLSKLHSFWITLNLYSTGWRTKVLLVTWILLDLELMLHRYIWESNLFWWNLLTPIHFYWICTQTLIWLMSLLSLQILINRWNTVSIIACTYRSDKTEILVSFINICCFPNSRSFCFAIIFKCY